eukprot:352178-Chlamydomonas_euryale.AAC.11
MESLYGNAGSLDDRKTTFGPCSHRFLKRLMECLRKDKHAHHCISISVGAQGRGLPAGTQIRADHMTQGILTACSTGKEHTLIAALQNVPKAAFLRHSSSTFYDGANTWPAPHSV